MESGGDLQKFFKAITATIDIDAVREQVEDRLYLTRRKPDSNQDIIAAANKILAVPLESDESATTAALLERAAMAIYRSAPSSSVKREREDENDREEEEEEEEGDEEGEDIMEDNDSNDADTMQDMLDAKNDLLCKLQNKIRRLSRTLKFMNHQIAEELQEEQWKGKKSAKAKEKNLKGQGEGRRNRRIKRKER